MAHKKPAGKALTASDSVQAALSAAEHPNYLGDPAVARKLIGDFVNFVANDGDTAQKNLAKVAKLEQIFAGQDPAYGAVPHWTYGGGLLAHLQHVLRVPDQELRSALHTTFLLLLRELYKVIRTFNEDEDTDKARYHLRVLTEEWVNHLLGIPTQRPHLYPHLQPGYKEEPTGTEPLEDEVEGDE